MASAAAIPPKFPSLRVLLMKIRCAVGPPVSVHPVDELPEDVDVVVDVSVVVDVDVVVDVSVVVDVVVPVPVPVSLAAASMKSGFSSTLHAAASTTRATIADQRTAKSYPLASTLAVFHAR
jgi:hypothetical protein